MSGKPVFSVVESPWDFEKYQQGEWTPGRSAIWRALWAVISLVVFESGFFPLYGFKRWILRCFGAKIGKAVVIKPNVRIKSPWRLCVGDFTWIGQGVWIDNLDPVEIGKQCCLSQDVYLCTGSHNHRRIDFVLDCHPISLGDHVWICARCTILPGVSIPSNRVVAAGQTIHKKAAEAMR